MEKKFTSDEVPLKQLLHEAQVGKLQLPDFQRGWVWDDNHIGSLLASISMSYPIGAVMILEAGNPDVRFRPRPLEGVELKHDVEPELLLLDGQQRSTSLYLALMSRAPVPTTDSKGKALKRRYYADMGICLDPDGDREEAIVSVPAERVVKTFQGEIVRDLTSRNKEIQNEMFPLDIILDANEVQHWQHEYVMSESQRISERLERWMSFYQSIVQPFDHYQVPTIKLVKSTPKEAVCAVFEKVNTGGVPLNVFELLTATYAADDFNLRDEWTARGLRLSEHDVLSKLDASQFLQIVTLLATYDRRSKLRQANPGDDKIPAVGCKRRDILRLDLGDYRRHAESALDGLLKAVPFLHAEHIFRAEDVPYVTQLVPLAAIFAVLGSEGQSAGAQRKIARWYWSGVFGEMYGGSVETRFALDIVDVVSFVRGDDEEPRTIRDSQFQAGRLLTLRTRLSAAYKGLYALQMKRGARDLRTGNTIDIHAYVDDAIDIHHIFPRAWCARMGVPEGLANCIVNKTAIDAHTNRRIGGRAPSAYLASIEANDGISPSELDELLRSHDIDSLAARQDDFALFFNGRFERLVKQIEAATGKPVNRSSREDESPYSGSGDASRSVLELVERGETKVVEFKSSGRVNLHTGDKDPRIEWSAIKAIAGFMNASGGTLLVGVTDDGKICGIQDDFPFVPKRDQDGWAQWLDVTTSTSLGKSAAAEIDLSFVTVDGRTVARIDVGPAAAPVFAKQPKGDGRPYYLVRINNSTQELSGEEALKHQRSRWRN